MSFANSSVLVNPQIPEWMLCGYGTPIAHAGAARTGLRPYARAATSASIRSGANVAYDSS